ncbi:multidrug resistance-associated protein 1-like [Littorina saxatilis]|uniref:multidrug resistance-associated protein 1-like n=1 Tax=Littorina saxatilis TaxID=31220 RepID=UPI0038B6079C
MADNNFEAFCGGAFWNLTLVLENTWPQFTDCFLHTVLIWVPCAFLFLSLPFYVTSVNKQGSRGTPFPVTLINGARLFCCITLATLSLVQLLVRTEEEAISRSVAAYLGDALWLAAFFVMVLMTQYERLKGAGQSSAVPFFFWLLTSLCNIIPFYTIIIQKLYERDLVSFTIVTLSFALQLTLLLLTACNDHGGHSDYTLFDDKPCPLNTCSFPSFLFFSWMTKLMINGYRRDLDESDLWTLPEEERSEYLVPTFKQLWQEEEQRCERINSARHPVKLNSVRYIASNGHGNGHSNGSLKKVTEKTHLVDKRADIDEEKEKKSTPSLIRVMVRMHLKTFVICYFQKVLSDLILLCSPLLLGVLISYLSDRAEGREWQGYVLCFGMALTIVVKAVLFAHSMFASTRIGVRIKATLIAAVYQKALSMNNASKTKSTVGEVVNLMSVDAQRILDMMTVFFFAFTTPVQIIVSIALLYVTIGPSILAGVLLLIMMMPLNGHVVMKQRTLQTDNLKFKDIRIRLFNEILNGIKVLKLYAWEPSFREKIREIRLKEIVILFKLAYLNIAMSISWDMAPYLVTLVTFATYILADPEAYLDAGKAFVTLSLFNILRAPLNLLSTMIMFIVQAQVSFKRINTFLLNEDLDASAVIRDDTAENVISIQDGNFSWDRSVRPTLTDINLNIGEGQLVAVVGPVGCGKSSLISAMLGEMETVQGKVTSRGSIAYVPQQAWIQNATVRDNILFGKPYKKKNYDKVMDTCELERDLTILSAGDMTEIGEKGINLSGGQKQRVSVARAVYSESDVYLFDDPLSAVDSHVGKAIFKKVIGPTGVLKKKTRVLVTHGVHWLPMVDEIIVMLDGKISERGSYEELVSHDGPFAQFLKIYLTEMHDSEDEVDPEIMEMRNQLVKRLDSITSDGFSSADELTIGTSNRRQRGSRRRRESEKKPRVDIEDSVASVIIPLKEAELTAGAGGRLTTTETIEKGKVDRQVFKDYGHAAGMVALATGFLSYCVYQGFSVGANFWLNVWTGDRALLNASTSDPEALMEGNHYYLAIFGVFGIVQLLFLLGFNYFFWTRMVMAARFLHSRLADRILHAPMSFFDTTPTGRILNRVSRDVETLDNTLPMIIRDWLVTFGLVLVTLIVIMIMTPLSGLVLLPVVVLYYFCQGFYVPTARQLKRIESVTRSPIYTLFSETLTGAASIRAYGATDRFLEESKARVDRNQIYYFATMTAVRWLQFNLDILAAMVVMAASLFTLLSSDSDSSDAGLSVSYALQVSGTLTWMTRQICEFETNIVSVERLKEYSELDTEAPWIIGDKRPPRSWPETGEVTFNNYQTRYREGLELVVKGVTCSIKDGERVGIVGRTGAGKSSLTLALFRLIEAAGGSILIDSVNIADMGLHDLRSRLTILPQDPVMFSGTLRMNLDPFDEYSEQQVWTALDRAHLRQSVVSLPGQLDFQCGEEGTNLSVGQRQLVCLARTLLRRTKILVLDEATAAVDMETDALIQNTIRTEFNHSTIITIAHRLNTIMDYDK